MAQKKEKWTNKLDDGHLCHSEQSSQTLSFTQTIYDLCPQHRQDVFISIALLVALKSPLRSSCICQLNIVRNEDKIAWQQPDGDAERQSPVRSLKGLYVRLRLSRSVHHPCSRLPLPIERRRCCSDQHLLQSGSQPANLLLRVNTSHRPPTAILRDRQQQRRLVVLCSRTPYRTRSPPLSSLFPTLTCLPNSP